MEVQLPYRPSSGFDGLYGLEITEITDQVAVGSVTVRPELKQPFGLIHGGVYAAIAD